jgi:hypothetical protein
MKGLRASREEIVGAMKSQKKEWREGEAMFTAAEWDAEQHPALCSVSCGMIGLRIVPVFKSALPVEFVQIPVAHHLVDDRVATAAQAFNFTWQSGGAWGNWRGGFLGYKELEDWPEPIRKVFERCDEKVNVRFVPTGDRPSLVLAQHEPLYQLLPLKSLRKHHLPVLARRTWPTPFFGDPDLDLGGTSRVLRARLEHAFADHLWPLLMPQSGLMAFSETDPIRLLAFNLDFWLPYLDRIVEERMRASGRGEYRNRTDRRMADRARRQLGANFEVEPPLYHADAWRGEAEAWDATCELVEAADAGGKLRAIIDAVQSHRVEDDFSDRWSWAKEDFERKLYSKRSKCRVSFVELRDTLPVHGSDKEVDAITELLWDDLLALVDPKERHVIVCLRNGVTRVCEIADVLGYATHSAVSKKLSRIRELARKFLGL